MILRHMTKIRTSRNAVHVDGSEVDVVAEILVEDVKVDKNGARLFERA